MKFFATLLIILFTTSMTFSQEKHDGLPKNSIRINSLALFPGFYEFQFERVMNEETSLKIGFGTGNIINKIGEKADKDFENAFGTNGFNNQNKHIVKAFSVNIDYRYFFTESDVPRGLYISPSIQYMKGNDNYTYFSTEQNRIVTLIDNDFSIFNLRAMFGYQFIIARQIIVNPYLGPGIAFGREKNNKNTNQYGSGFSLNAGLDLGISF